MSESARNELSAWKKLQDHCQTAGKAHLRDLFASDPDRGRKLTLDAVGIYFDYSKNRVTDETLKLLIKLAEECDLPGRIRAMFGGEKINTTENRAVLHVALRCSARPRSSWMAKTSCRACMQCSTK